MALLEAHHGSSAGIMGKNRNRNGNPPGHDGYRLVGGRRPTSSGSNGGYGGGGGYGGNGGNGGNNLVKQLQQLLLRNGGNGGGGGNGGNGGKPKQQQQQRWQTGGRWTDAEMAKWWSKTDAERAEWWADQKDHAHDDTVPAPEIDPVATENTKAIRAHVQELQRAKVLIHQPGLFPAEYVAGFDKMLANRQVDLQTSKPAWVRVALLRKIIVDDTNKATTQDEHAAAYDKAAEEAVEAAKQCRERAAKLRANVEQCKTDLPKVMREAGIVEADPKAGTTDDQPTEDVDPAIQQMQQSLHKDPEAIAMLAALQQKLAAQRSDQSSTEPTAPAQHVDASGDTGMAGDNQVPATSTNTTTADTEATQAAEMAELRAGMERAASEAAAVRAQLEEQLQIGAARETQMAELQNQIAGSTPPVPDTTSAAAAARDRDSRSRSAEKRRGKKPSKS